MGWQVFGTLPAGNQPLSVFDTLTAEIAKCVLIPCTAANANAIVLSGTANAPSILAYSDLVSFNFVAAANSTGTVTIQFAALPALNAYFADGVTQVAAGGVVSGQPYTAIFSQALNAGAGGFYLGQQVQKASGTQPTRTVLTSGSSATYTTPGGAKQLLIRMVGGGGSGGTNSTSILAGNPGTASVFNAITANFGAAGSAGSGSTGGAGGAGGSAGAGSASFRIPGQAGTNGVGLTSVASFNMTAPGGNGGQSFFGGGGTGGGPGGAAGTNSGSGGAGSQVLVTGAAAGSAGGGGGAGEYLELIINTPVATYTYTVGAGGAAVGAGANASGAGAAGIIIVEERY